jgi:hypothetical protein
MAITTGERTGSATYGAIKLAGLAGLVSIALGVGGSIVDEMQTFPGTGASAGEIAGYVDAHRSALLVATVLSTVAVGLWLAFGVGIWVWLRERTGSVSVLSVCFLVGLVSFVTLLLTGFTSFFVLVYRAGDVSDPRLLYDLAFGLLAMSGVPTALALGSYAAQGIQRQSPPKLDGVGCRCSRAGAHRAPGFACDHARFLLAGGRSDHCDSRHAVRLDRRCQHRPATSGNRSRQRTRHTIGVQ